jgi:hypothetical protein
MSIFQKINKKGSREPRLQIDFPGFPLLYSVRDFIGAIGSHPFDPRALENL